jgi:predicted dehydrogenase
MSQLRVGVIGLGMMGQTHLDVYAKRPDVQVVAIADGNSDRLSGRVRTRGNIEGQSSNCAVLTHSRKFLEGMDLIHDADVDIVDLCLPTPMHRTYTEAALAAKRHVLVEKPLARTAVDAFALADAAEASGLVVMPAMCMRFWPGWDWLKSAVDDERYGRLLSVSICRLSSHPGRGFYSSGEASGGAILDLHIHDTDFVQYLLGMPESVFSRGYSRHTSDVDHVATQYIYKDGPLVTSEGGWTMSPGFSFHMQYVANFDRATATFNFGSKPTLMLASAGKVEAISLLPGMGYEYEIDAFLRCVREGQQPSQVTMRDAARSIAIVEAERTSVTSGKPEVIASRIAVNPVDSSRTPRWSSTDA